MCLHLVWGIAGAWAPCTHLWLRHSLLLLTRPQATRHHLLKSEARRRRLTAFISRRVLGDWLRSHVGLQATQQTVGVADRPDAKKL